MRVRNIQINIRLDEKESKRLERISQKSGMSMSAVIRSLIMNVKLTERPTDEYIAVKKELSAIGNNLNQLARHANTFGEIDRTEFKAVHDDLQKLWAKVRDS